MAQANKTQPTDQKVEDYLASIADPKRQHDARQVCLLMQEITGEKPVMWGSSIVGFGKLHYQYASGREGDTVVVGLSARKQALTLYGVIFYDQGLEMAKQLGKHTTGKGCLYIKSLDDVDLVVLSKMIEQAWQQKRTA